MRTLPVEAIVRSAHCDNGSAASGQYRSKGNPTSLSIVQIFPVEPGWKLVAIYSCSTPTRNKQRKVAELANQALGAIPAPGLAP